MPIPRLDMVVELRGSIIVAIDCGKCLTLRAMSPVVDVDLGTRPAFFEPPP
jgi:hypothetical protein